MLEKKQFFYFRVKPLKKEVFKRKFKKKVNKNKKQITLKMLKRQKIFLHQKKN